MATCKAIYNGQEVKLDVTNDSDYILIELPAQSIGNGYVTPYSVLWETSNDTLPLETVIYLLGDRDELSGYKSYGSAETVTVCYNPEDMIQSLTQASIEWYL